MARFSQRFIRSVIRQVWNQAGAEADSFLSALNTCQAGHWEQNATGWTVSSSSGAGYHTAFHISTGPNDAGGMTPMEWQELFELILENYAKVAACGITENQAFDGSTSPNLDAMQSLFVHRLWKFFPTVKGYVDNFMWQNS